MTRDEYRRRRMAGLFVGVAAMALPQMVGAQQVVDDTTYLGAITLQGTGLETSVFESPSAVTVVGQEEIEHIPARRVADFLENVPGVRVEEEGITRIRIRGEEARRTRILLNGQAVTDHTTYGPPVVIDPSTVERIEVVRGASSVVSGQRAIGGTVNIITKRRTDKPFEASTSLSWFGATDGWRLSNSVAGRQGGFTWRLNQGASVQGNQKAVGYGELDPSNVTDRNLSGYVGYEVDNHWFGFEAQQFKMASGVYVHPSQIPEDIDKFAVELPRRDLRKFNLFYEGTDLTPWLTSLKVDMFRQTIDRDFRNHFEVAPQFPLISGVFDITNKDKQTTYGINASAELRFSDRVRSIVGAQYENDFLDVHATTDYVVTTAFGGTTISDGHPRLEESRVITSSIFMQNEFTLSPEWSLNLGGRYYHVRSKLEKSNVSPLSSKSDSRFLTSAGVVWTPHENWALRALFSQGYNYPTLNQLFTDTSAGGIDTLHNPDLKAETADNFELGARFDSGRTVIDATLFHTRAKDYIARIGLAAADCPNARTECEKYFNVDRARTSGVELYAEHQLDSGLTPFISAALIHRKLEYGNGFSTADSGTPRLAGTIGLRRDFEVRGMPASFDLFLDGESRSKLRSDAGVVTSSAGGWATFNMRGSIDFNEHASLTAQVNNLFNQQYWPMDQIPGAERSIDLVFTARF